MHIKIFLVLICLSVSLGVQGQNLKDFKFMPELPDPASYEGMSCNELYAEATRLEPQTQHVRSPLINAETDLYVSTIGTVFEPVLYYYGFYIPWHYREEYRIHKTSEVMDNIRYRMSSMNCFVK